MSGENPAQMELGLPVGLESLYGFAWPGTPRWAILNDDEVLVSVISEPLNVRRCEGGYACLLQAANTSVIYLEQTIQDLRNKNVAFCRATSPEIFGDAISLEVFTSCPINMESGGDIHGMGRLIIMSKEIHYIGPDFPLIIIKRGHTPNIKGWVWVKKTRYMTYSH